MMEYGMITVVIRHRLGPNKPKLSPQAMWSEVHRAAGAKVFGLSMDLFWR